MLSGESVMPAIRWPVLIKHAHGHSHFIKSFGPAAHVWQLLSATASVVVCIIERQLFLPNWWWVCWSISTETVIFGGCSGQLGTKELSFHSIWDGVLVGVRSAHSDLGRVENHVGWWNWMKLHLVGCGSALPSLVVQSPLWTGIGWIGNRPSFGILHGNVLLWRSFHNVCWTRDILFWPLFCLLVMCGCNLCRDGCCNWSVDVVFFPVYKLIFWGRWRSLMDVGRLFGGF